jgi:hypothetical protein
MVAQTKERKKSTSKASVTKARDKSGLTRGTVVHLDPPADGKLFGDGIKGALDTPSVPQEKPKAIAGTLVLPVQGGHVAEIPGLPGAKRATGYIKVDQIPDVSAFTQVNPRAPKPTGTVPKAIVKTLTTTPLQMAIKNAGIYLLAQSIEPGTGDTLLVELRDPHKHGLVNGGHTYAMIRQVIESGTPEEKAQLAKASVPIHVYSGIPDALIVEMASGLNTSRQVQEASLEHLRGHYDQIKKVLDKIPGGDQVAYYEGDVGTVPIGEILAYIEMFNLERYPLTDNPFGLYAHRGRVIQEASEDFSLRSEAITLVIDHLPDILKLADTIRRNIQELRGVQEPERRGRGRPSKKKPGNEAPKEKPARIVLPFIGEKVKERLPNGWLYPILAAFRANVKWDLTAKKFGWKKSNDAVLKSAADELVRICLSEQRAAAGKPEWVGKRESAYRQCKMQVDLTIQQLGGK